LEIIFLFPVVLVGLVVLGLSLLGLIITYQLADPPLVVLPFIFILNLVDVTSSMAADLATYLFS
jgi:hypothetical protein